MSARSVREYLAGELGNLTVATIEEKVVVVPIPPSVDSLTGPTIWIWPIDFTSERVTAARGWGGKRQFDWFYSVSLVWAFDPQTTDVGCFDDFMDVVITTFETLPGSNITLTDSVSGKTSQLVSVAEGPHGSNLGKIVAKYRTPGALRRQGKLVYDAVLKVGLREWVNA